MRILLSNDDGIHAVGLHTMYKELAKIGRVWVVAPTIERSTTGHHLTVHKPLRITKLDPKIFPGNDFYAVSGGPADCVQIGISEIIKEAPDLVVSGVNRGANLAQDVYYSGTVSAAREGCIFGVPAISVSLALNGSDGKDESELHYVTAAKFVLRVIENLEAMRLPKHTFLNFNVPNLPKDQIKGIKIVRQGFQLYSKTVLKRVDHKGKEYYWVGGSHLGFADDPDTDCTAIDSSFAALTPIKLDTTDFETLQLLKQEAQWNQQQ